MKKKVLFVDDERNVLDGLRRMLRGMRKEWDMEFAESGEEALQKLAEREPDVIVSDMRMPRMDGAELLAEVQRRYPDVVRIILSGHSELKMIMRSVKPAHQFLSKPCPADKLKDTLERACSLRMMLVNVHVKRIVSQLESLPAMPSTYCKVMAEMEKETSSLARIGEIIGHDVAMTASILKLVNSAFFGLARHISSPEQAVNLLGIEVVKALILSVHLFSKFDDTWFPGYSVERLHDHCLAAGTLAKCIAEKEGYDKEFVDQCFIAGVLHDVGKLILATEFRDEYGKIIQTVQEDNRTVVEVEREFLGTTHAEIGAYLIGLWGLPGMVVEAIAFHHNPSALSADAFMPLTAVHAANAIDHEVYVINDDYNRHRLDPEYLNSLGLKERMTIWTKGCVRDAGQEERT